MGGHGSGPQPKPKAPPGTYLARFGPGVNTVCEHATKKRVVLAIEPGPSQPALFPEEGPVDCVLPQEVQPVDAPPAHDHSTARCSCGKICLCGGATCLAMCRQHACNAWQRHANKRSNRKCTETCFHIRRLRRKKFWGADFFQLGQT